MYDTASQAEDPKVAFLVPTVALVEQQLKVFQRYLSPSCRCIGISGKDEMTMNMSHLVDTNDVLVMTPQILLNALRGDDLKSLQVFDLLVFDECHRMTGNHPYNNLMGAYYVDVLLRQTPESFRLPQVSVCSLWVKWQVESGRIVD